MTSIKSSAFQEFLSTLEGFDQLPPEVIASLSEQLQPLRYRIGQKIIGKERVPEKVTIIYEGKARLLAYDSRTKMPTTLNLLEPGAVLGEISLLRQVACEITIASNEVICITFGAAEYLRLLAMYPAFAEARKNRCHLMEVFDVLSMQKEMEALGSTNLKELTQHAWTGAKIHNLPPGKSFYKQLDSDYIWFVSGGGTVKGFSVGSRLQLSDLHDTVEVQGDSTARLLGMLASDMLLLDNMQGQQYQVDESDQQTTELEIPYAPDEETPPPQPSKAQERQKTRKYPFFGGKGQLNSAQACFQMLAKHLEMPSRKEVVRRIFNDQMKRNNVISFHLCAYLAELTGLKAQLVDVPTSAITRIPTPALIHYGDSYAVLYETSERNIVVGVPSKGILRFKPTEFITHLQVEESNYPPQFRVLLLSSTPATPRQRFGVQWFVPYLSRYRRVLIEVFVASFFVQLAALANPLVIQMIIDKVIAQNSISTLHVLGVLLLVVGLFEAVLGTLRTYLFVDTTNRIDMGLGSEIIDHMLRLPLRYFERRPVGELSTRINELENIRQFLTGTALTVGLDALFSVVYIIVMLIYSWQLT
ncbi:MAG: ABC transporter transmembrane domain-containing protein, partial [Brasilonema sp.]